MKLNLTHENMTAEKFVISFMVFDPKFKILKTVEILIFKFVKFSILYKTGPVSIISENRTINILLLLPHMCS